MKIMIILLRGMFQGRRVLSFVMSTVVTHACTQSCLSRLCFGLSLSLFLSLPSSLSLSHCHSLFRSLSSSLSHPHHPTHHIPPNLSLSLSLSLCETKISADQGASRCNGARCTYVMGPDGRLYSPPAASPPPAAQGLHPATKRNTHLGKGNRAQSKGATKGHSEEA